MATDVFKVTACTYASLPANTPVFNVELFAHKLLVYLNPDDCRDLKIFALHEVTDDLVELSFPEGIVRERECWLSIDSALLNKKPGLHIYKISLVSMDTGDTSSLYFAYTAQTNHPDRPYIYMDGNCSSGCSNKCMCTNEDNS